MDTSLPGAGDFLSVDQADDLYLSKTVDDEAAGAITFKGLTTHEGGINTQQIKDTTTDAAIDYGTGANSIRIQNDGWSATVGAGNQARNLNVTWSSTEVLDPSYTFAYNISSTLLQPVSPTANVTSFWATANNQSTSGIVSAFRTGVKADANAGTGGAYAFYAGGDAPSYFAGGVQFDLTHSQSNGTQDQLLFDEYERGSWTPTITWASNPAWDKDPSNAQYIYLINGHYALLSVRFEWPNNSTGRATITDGNRGILSVPFGLRDYFGAEGVILQGQEALGSVAVSTRSTSINFTPKLYDASRNSVSTLVFTLPIPLRGK